MRRVDVLLVFFIFMASTPSYAEMKLGESAAIVFATVDEGRQVLTSRDEFVKRMSPFDRVARMKMLVPSATILAW